MKDRRIDVGFGRIRFEDDALRRIVLREERLVAAIPETHTLAQGRGAVSLGDLAMEPLLQPRPSYADQVIRLFHDQGLEPRIAHEARELQIAIGLVAAEEGVAIVPESVHKSQLDGVAYRDLIKPAASRIIMRHRADDQSPELRLMALVVARTYAGWGYDVPDGITRLAHRVKGPLDGP